MQPFEQFEHEFARWADTPHVVGCSSGTAALHLALEALELPPASEILIPDFTMVAVARAVALAGHIPVLIDCRADLNLDPYVPDDALSERAAALIAVHTYGRTCDMIAVHLFAQRHGLRVVEDLAEAHGISPHLLTDAAAWSFYRNKEVAGEEGGAVAFREEERVQFARELRCLGFTPAHDFLHRPRGHNYRLSNAHAVLILQSLRKFDEHRAARREVEGWYNAECPPEWQMLPRAAPWVYDLRILGMTWEEQTRAVQALQAAGIAARHAFKPMSYQPEFAACRVVCRAGLGLREAERASREVIYLPLTPGDVTPESAQRAFAILTDTLGHLL